MKFHNLSPHMLTHYPHTHIHTHTQKHTPLLTCCSILLVLTHLCKDSFFPPLLLFGFFNLLTSGTTINQTWTCVFVSPKYVAAPVKAISQSNEDISQQAFSRLDSGSGASWEWMWFDQHHVFGAIFISKATKLTAWVAAEWDAWVLTKAGLCDMTTTIEKCESSFSFFSFFRFFRCCKSYLFTAVIFWTTRGVAHPHSSFLILLHMSLPLLPCFFFPFWFSSSSSQLPLFSLLVSSSFFTLLLHIFLLFLCCW